VVEIELGVDADELHKETTDTAEEQVFAGEEAQRKWFAAAFPEPPADCECEEELIDGCGLDECVWRVGWDKGVPLHVNAPGERGVDAVVAVAGGEAAKPANAVADGSSRCGEVQHTHGCSVSRETVGPGVVALNHEHGDAGQEAPKPGESGLEPVQEAEQDFHRVMPGG